MFISEYGWQIVSVWIYFGSTRPNGACIASMSTASKYCVQQNVFIFKVWLADGERMRSRHATFTTMAVGSFSAGHPYCFVEIAWWWAGTWTNTYTCLLVCSATHARLKGAVLKAEAGAIRTLAYVCEDKWLCKWLAQSELLAYVSGCSTQKWWQVICIREWVWNPVCICWCFAVVLVYYMYVVGSSEVID